MSEENLFKKWNPTMAYILGYFVADGDMSINKRGSYYIGFTSTDYELIQKVKTLGGFSQRIGIKKSKKLNQKTGYRIQIGSRKMFSDICRLGFDKRRKRFELNKIPLRHFRHFVRGFFDGDGNVNLGSYRFKNRKFPSRILIVRFTSGDKKLLLELLGLLRRRAVIVGGSFHKKTRGFEISFSINDSFRLFHYMYSKVSFAQCLKRKYNIFQRAISLWGRSSAG